MGNSIKRFLSLALAIMMIISIIPTNARAVETDVPADETSQSTPAENANETPENESDTETEPTATEAAVESVAEGEEDSETETSEANFDFTDATADEEGEGFAWNNESKTLTLSGVAITEAVVLPKDSTIVVTAGTENSVVVASGNAIYSNGALAITGTGTLTVAADSEYSCAVVAPSVTITDTKIDLYGFYYGIQAKPTTDTADSVVTLTNVSGKIVGYGYGGINAHSETTNVTVKLTRCKNLVIKNEVNADNTRVEFKFAGIRAYTRGSGKDALVELNGCENVSISNSTMAIVAATNATTANVEAAEAKVLIKDSTGIELNANTSCWSAVFANNYGIENDDSCSLVIEASELKINAPYGSGLMTSTKSAPSEVDVASSNLDITAGMSGIRTIASSAEYTDTDVSASNITFQGALKGNPVDESTGSVAADDAYYDDASIIVTKTTVTKLDELKAALAEGGNIVLGADIIVSEKLTVSKDTTITGEYTLTRADSYTGTLFTVNAGATLTLDGGLTIDGGNEWTFDEEGFMAALYDSSSNNSGLAFVTPEEGAPKATAPMINIDGAVVAKNVTIKNHLSTTGSNDGSRAVFKLNNGATLTMTGAKVTHCATGDASTVWGLNGGSTLTINVGTEISGNYGGRNGAISRVNNSTVIMNGGSINHNYSVNANGSIFMMYGSGNCFYMNGGEICTNYATKGGNGRTSAIYLHSAGKMVMEGGSICHNVGSGYAGIDSNQDSGSYLTITDGSVVNNVSSGGNPYHDINWPSSNTGAAISGGTFTQDVSKWCAESFKVVDLGNGTYGVVEDPTHGMVAQVGETYYKSVQEAINAANGNPVVLIADIVLDDINEVKALPAASNGNGKYCGFDYGNGAFFNVIGGNVTFNLNGHSITYNIHDEAWCNKRVVSIFYVTDKANLTIIDRVGTGKVTVNGMATAVYSVASDTKVTISGGTWTWNPCETCGATNVFLYASHGGELYIKNGTFTNNVGGDSGEYMIMSHYSSKETTENSAGVDYDSTKVDISGGTFYGYNPGEIKYMDNGNGNAESMGDGCAEGFVPTKNDDGSYCVRMAVAEVNGTKYESLQAAVNAADDGDTIVVIAEVELESTVVVDKDVTLNLNGKTITTAATAANVFVDAFQILADVTVTGNGTINAKNGYVFYVGDRATNAAGNLVIKNGTYTSKDSTVAQATVGTITVEGGEFSAAPHNGAYDFTFNCDDTNYKNGSAKIVVKGGTFHNWNPADNEAEGVATNFVDAGYIAETKDEGATYTVRKANYVAEVNGTKYESLTEAIAAAKEANTSVTVLQTIVLTENLDMQGVRLNAAPSIQNAPVFRVLGNVTIINPGIVDGRGPVAGEGGINCYAFIVGNSETAGTLTITGGTYRGVTSAISITNGVVNISGGVFQTGHDNEGTDWGTTYLLNCADAAYKNGTAKFNITGGRFNGFNPEDNAAEGANTNFLSGNYKASDYYDNDKWYVAEANVVMDGDKYFATLKDALATLSSADTTVHTVKILQDHQINVNDLAYGKFPVVINGFNVLLDLNGKTITADWSKYTGTRKDNSVFGLFNGGKLTIVDTVGGGTVDNLSDGKDDVENRIFWLVAGHPNKEQILTIEGGTFIQRDDINLLYVEGSGNPADKAVLANINGGHFEMAHETFKDFFNSYDNRQQTTTISGGTFNVNPTDKEIRFPEGYEAAQIADGIWGIVEIKVAKIGNVTYPTLAAAVAAAKPGQIITLICDAKGPGVVIDKKLTIDFGGFTYTLTDPVGSTGTESNGFQILEGNTVTLRNGTLKVADSAADKFYILIQNYADLNLNKMTLDGTNLDKYSRTDGDSYTLSNNSGYVAVSGTKIIANDEGDLAFAFDVCDKSDWGYDLPVVVVNSTSKITGNIEAVAQIGTKYYATLQQAVDAAAAGAKIILVRDSAGAGVVIDKNITILFGKHTYTLTEPVGSTGTKSNGFQILKGNTVVLQNGTLKVADSAADKFYILVQNYANLTVNNMTLDGTNLDKYSKTDGDSYTLSNNSGNVSIGGKTVIIANNDGDKAFAFDACDKSAWGYELPVVSVATTVTIAGEIEAAAKVGNTYYATLQQAIDACNVGGTVTLVSDASGAGVVINKNININFNNKTYTLSEPVGSTGTVSNGFQILNGNKVTLKNGTLKVADSAADKFYILVQNYADLTVTDMTLDGSNLDKWSKTDGDSYTLSINSGTVKVTSSKIIANKDGAKAFAFDVCKYGNYATPVVTVDAEIDGRVECAGQIGTRYYATFEEVLAAAKSSNTVILHIPAVITKDTTFTNLNFECVEGVYPAFRIVNGATLTVNGGNYTNAYDYTFVLGASDGSSEGNLVVNSGKIHGATTAISVTKGTLTINGGEFSADGYDSVYTINCVDANYKNGTAKVSITGGKFTGFNPADNEAEGANTNFCAEGYCTTKSGNVYTVVAASAKIGDTYFATLKEAVASVAKGAGETTITLLKNQSVSGQFIGHSYAQQITLDLNGYTLSSSDKALTVYRGGTVVTIKNGTITGNTSGGTIQVTYGGKLIISDNVTVKAGGQALALKVDANSTLIVNGENVQVMGGKKGDITSAGTVEISSGIFNYEVKEAWCALGYEPCTVDGGKYSVRLTAVAKIGTNVYKTLNAAIEAAVDGDTITLMQDISLTENDVVKTEDGLNVMFAFEGKDVTLDLNGKTINVDYKIKDRLYAVVYVANGATLTVNATNGGGIDVTAYQFDNSYENVAYMFWKRGTTGKLIINGGNYHANKLEDSMVYTNGSQIVTVNGGKFILDNIGTDANGSPWIFNAQGRNERHIIVNGGTFNADVFHQYWVFEAQSPETVALQKNDDGTYTVVNAVAYVAEVYGKYTKHVGYATVEEAQKVATENGWEYTVIRN